MTCSLCRDRGIVRERYQDGSPDAFGVCLCAAGQAWRDDRNALGKPTGCPAWMIWAAQNHVPQEQMFHIEDLLEEADLAAIPRAAAPTRRGSIPNAMRLKRPKL